MKTLTLSFAFSVLLLWGCRSSILDDPTTTIRYVIEEPSHVKLTIENSYNTIIMTPVDEDMEAGIHQTSVSMSNLTEGIYFYTLECRGTRSAFFSRETHQMLLLK